jgi:hypothetical protein
MLRKRPRARTVHQAAEHIAPLLSGVLLAGLRDADLCRPMKMSALKRLTTMGLIERGPFRSHLTERGRLVLAIATETRRAETTGSVEEEGAGRQASPKGGPA